MFWAGSYYYQTVVRYGSRHTVHAFTPMVGDAPTIVERTEVFRNRSILRRLRVPLGTYGAVRTEAEVVDESSVFNPYSQPL